MYQSKSNKSILFLIQIHHVLMMILTLFCWQRLSIDHVEDRQDGARIVPDDCDDYVSHGMESSKT